MFTDQYEIYSNKSINPAARKKNAVFYEVLRNIRLGR